MLEGACQGRMEHLLWLERLCSALWVPSFPIDTRHFKRGLATVSEEVTPQKMGECLPSLCLHDLSTVGRCIQGVFGV